MHITFLCFLLLVQSALLSSCSEGSFNSGGPNQNLKTTDIKPEGEVVELPTNSPTIEIDSGRTVTPLAPKFGLMLNNASCSFCHIQVHGDIASTLDVDSASLASQSGAEVIGAWYGAGSIQLRNVTSASKGFFANHTSEDGTAFRLPVFDRPFIEQHSDGRLVASDVEVNGIHLGNLVINGRDQNPFTINGDVLVDGDLVILGRYSGRGNIYVTGHIYIPFDLIAQQSAFPFPPNDESRHAKSAMELGTDSLGLAANGVVLIGDLGHQIGNWYTGKKGGDWIYNDGKNYDKIYNVRRVYDWYPGGRQAYESLYGHSWNCITNTMNVIGSFNRIDAMLYSPNMVAGIARRGVYSINGGVITDTLHIVARRGNLKYSFSGKAASACTGAVNPVSGLPTDKSRIQYDFRIQHGLPVLRLLRP